jgi:hypothetical protein
MSDDSRPCCMLHVGRPVGHYISNDCTTTSGVRRPRPTVSQRHISNVYSEPPPGHKLIHPSESPPPSPSPEATRLLCSGNMQAVLSPGIITALYIPFNPPSLCPPHDILSLSALPPQTRSGHAGPLVQSCLPLPSPLPCQPDRVSPTVRLTRKDHITTGNPCDTHTQTGLYWNPMPLGWERHGASPWSCRLPPALSSHPLAAPVAESGWRSLMTLPMPLARPSRNKNVVPTTKNSE